MCARAPSFNQYKYAVSRQRRKCERAYTGDLYEGWHQAPVTCRIRAGAPAGLMFLRNLQDCHTVNGIMSHRLIYVLEARWRGGRT